MECVHLSAEPQRRQFLIFVSGHRLKSTKLLYVRSSIVHLSTRIRTRQKYTPVPVQRISDSRSSRDGDGDGPSPGGLLLGRHLVHHHRQHAIPVGGPDLLPVGILGQAEPPHVPRPPPLDPYGPRRRRLCLASALALPLGLGGLLFWYLLSPLSHHVEDLIVFYRHLRGIYIYIFI